MMEESVRPRQNCRGTELVWGCPVFRDGSQYRGGMAEKIWIIG